MSEQESFEARFKELYPYDDISGFEKEIGLRLWNAATAVSDKRIAELKAELKTKEPMRAVTKLIMEEIDRQQEQITELQAHINVLREALEKLAGTNGYVKSVALQALASTPAQSLQEHDDEVIEHIINICRGYWTNVDCIVALAEVTE